MSVGLGREDVVSEVPEMTTAKDFCQYAPQRLSRANVVQKFAVQLGGLSSDGIVHSDGEILCCRCSPIARWWRGTMYLTPPRRLEGESEYEVRGLLKGLLRE